MLSAGRFESLATQEAYHERLHAMLDGVINFNLVEDHAFIVAEERTLPHKTMALEHLNAIFQNQRNGGSHAGNSR